MYPLYSEPRCSNTTCSYYTICDQVPTKAFQSEYRNASDPMDVFILTEYPTWKESYLRNFWSSSVGSILTKFFEKEFPNYTYAISSVVRAWPYKPESLVRPQYNGCKASAIPEWVLSKAQTAPVHQHPYAHNIVKSCSEYWIRDIEYWKPKKIIIMGSLALKAMFPNENRSVLDLVDETLYYNNIPVKVVSSSHFILQKPSLKVTWLQKLKRTMLDQKQAFFNNPEYGVWTDIEPKYFIWNYKLLKTVEEVEEVVDRFIRDKKPISLDTETENLHKKYNTSLGMIQIANDPRIIYAIPWIHYESPFDANDLERLKVVLQRLFSSTEIPYWITWNCKFELNIIENTLQVSLATKIYDGICAESLLDENRLERVSEFKYGIYTLKQLGLDRIGYDGWNKAVLAARGDGSLMDLPLEKVAEYGCVDVGITLLVAQHQMQEAEETGYDNFLPLVFGLYDPIIRVFSQVERDGFPASRDYIRSLIQKSSPILIAIKECSDAIINSPEGQRANKIILDRTTRVSIGNVSPLARTPTVLDLSKTGHPQVLFFEVMGLEPVTVSDAGTASVDEEFQEKYKKTPLVAKFSEYVEAKKMFDSFAKPIYDYLDTSGPHTDCKTDQRIRPDFKVSGVVTGRISCTNPNIQACIAPDSLVIQNNTLKFIKDLDTNNKEIFSLNKNEKFEYFFVKKSSLYRVTDSHNNWLDCSPDHIHLVINDNFELLEKTTIDLLNTDYLITNIYPWLEEKDSTLSAEEARFWGYMLSIESGYLDLCNIDKDVFDDFIQCANKSFPTLDIDITIKICNKTLQSFIDNVVVSRGLNKKAKDKTIPDFILDSGKSNIKNFLKALFSGDGGVNKKHFAMVDYSSTSEVLIRQVQALLLGFGIPSSSKTEREYVTKSGRIGVCYRLKVYGLNVNKFHNEIGFVGNRANGMQAHYQYSSQEKLPIIKALNESKYRKHYKLHEIGNAKNCLTKEKIKKLDLYNIIKKHEPDSHILKTLDFVLQDFTRLAKVKKVELISEESDVYDMTIPSTSLFWANGFITHNCPRAETPVKKAIKNIFQVNRKGRILVQLDFKANEMRWVCIASGDKAMAKKFNDGKEALDKYKITLDKEDFKLASLLGDIHKQNASSAFKTPISEVTKDQRQAAKGCLRKGTLVNTKRGLVKVEDVKIGDYVWTGGSWTIVEDLHRPIQHVYRITLERGITIDVSEDHEILTTDINSYNEKFTYVTGIDTNNDLLKISRKSPDYENVVDLSEYNESANNASIILSKKNDTYPAYYPKKMDEKLAWLIGAMIAEGGSLQNSTKNAMSFSQSKSESYLEEFRIKYKELFGVEASETISIRKNKKHKNITIIKLSAFVGKFLKYCGYIGGSENKEVPWSILQSNKKCQLAFIRGYMDGDGSAPKSGSRSVKASSKSEQLIKQVRIMLLNLGIISSQGIEKHKLPKKQIFVDYHVLQISGPDYEQYFNIVGESNSIKYRKVSRRHQKEVVRGIMNILKKEIKSENSKFNIHDNSHVIDELSHYELEKNWPRYKDELTRLGKLEYIDRIEKVISDKHFVSKILKVEKITTEPEEVYDLVLPKPDIWFMAEGMIHFDCTFGVLYDSSEQSVSELYNIPLDETIAMFQGFFETHHWIYAWKMEMKEMARQKGYVEAPHGRRRRFPIFDIFRNENGWFDQNLVPKDHISKINEALRQASNSPIQGIASDAANIGANNLRNYIKRKNKDWLMCNVVHDSCIVDIPVQDMYEYAEVAERLFTTDVMDYFNALWDIDFIAPIEIDFDFGTKWGELKAWDFSPQSLKEMYEDLLIKVK